MKPPRALSDVNSIPSRAEIGAQCVKGFFGCKLPWRHLCLQGTGSWCGSNRHNLSGEAEVGDGTQGPGSMQLVPGRAG